jgi:Fur family iron response transcriptional regulator|tara:strand:- start:960 stop:1388 length:429 start_codon:yes stop_codon:yes gene_type:complete
MVAITKEFQRPFTKVLNQLRKVGLRPTRQRLALAKLLFEGGNRHVTAEVLHAEAQAANIKVSIATIYNTLHQFTSVGLLREIFVDSQRLYFDTYIADHHHFFHEGSGRLEDIPSDQIVLSSMPSPPDGTKVKRVEVIVRVEN